MKIKIFATGGTLDKEYNEITEKFHFKESHLKEMLKVGRVSIRFKVERLMMIDSLEMTDTDRKKILGACQKTKESKILITHGTGTIDQTAKFLQKAHLKKTIVLTGAMIPYRVVGSDALFNLGVALAFVQTLTPGVYVAMNGRLFVADNVFKNTKIGYFQELT